MDWLRIHPADDDRFGRWDWGSCAAVALAAMAVYISTLCPTVYTSGAAENITAVATLGVPHPPGFPLFCLLGKVFTLLLPVGSAALRVNLFAASCGAAAAAAIFLALRRLLGPAARPACATAALLFAFSRTFWSQAVIAEVYTLNALCLVSILLAILAWERNERGGKLWPVGLLIGLGLCVHPLQVFFFPAWVILVLGSRRRKALDRRAVLHAALAFVLGVALHLYAPIRSRMDPFLDWGNPEGWKNLVAYATAAQYRGRMFALPADTVLANAWRAARQLFGEFSPWLSPLPLVGAWLLFRRRQRLLFATLIPAAVTFVYAVDYDIPWEIEVYFIPVVLVLAIWSGAALSWIAERLGRAAIALPLLALLPLLHGFEENDRSQHRVVLALGRDLLASSPHGARLILPDTDPTFALLYLQAVEGARPDVAAWVSTGGALKPLQRALDPDSAPLSLTDVVESADGPVLSYERISPEALPGWQSSPIGVLYHLHRKGESAPDYVPDPASLELEAFVSPRPDFPLDERTRVVLANYSIGMGDAERARGASEAARARYLVAAELGGEIAVIQRELGMRFAELGETELAIDWLRRGTATRDDALAENRLGRALVSSKRLNEALAAFTRAIRLEPDNATAHSNRGGCLAMLGRADEALVEFEKAVELDPRNVSARNNLGQALLIAGDRDGALAQWRASLAIDPAQDEVRRGIEQLGERP